MEGAEGVDLTVIALVGSGSHSRASHDVCNNY